jgi:TetR/AcrR family fatty acid metabolism transcriptional regulator
MLLECIKEGIETGTFRKNTDPYLVRSIILGTIEHLCTRKHLQGQPENMLSQVDPMVDLILSGIRAPQEQQNISIHLHMTGTAKAPETITIVPEERKP